MIWRCYKILTLNVFNACHLIYPNSENFVESGSLQINNVSDLQYERSSMQTWRTTKHGIHSECNQNHCFRATWKNGLKILLTCIKPLTEFFCRFVCIAHTVASAFGLRWSSRWEKPPNIKAWVQGAGGMQFKCNRNASIDFFIHLWAKWQQ